LSSIRSRKTSTVSPDLDVGLMARRLAGGGEFLEVDAAFRFEADIDEHRVVLDRQDAALDDGALEAARASQGLVQQRGEALLLRRGGFRTCC
jgi:hypothetical protein